MSNVRYVFVNEFILIKGKYQCLLRIKHESFLSASYYTDQTKPLWEIYLVTLLIVMIMKNETKSGIIIHKVISVYVVVLYSLLTDYLVNGNINYYC